MYQAEVQVSYGLANLNPSVPTDKTIKVLIGTLNNDKEQFKERTKLKLRDIHRLTELCLSNCYFLYENSLRLFQDSVSENYLQKLECKAIMEALNYKIVPKTFRRFVDGNHAFSQERSHADKFLETLNKQDPVIKYTVEFADHKQY